MVTRRAAVYGCIYSGCTATSGTSVAVRSSRNWAAAHGSMVSLSVKTSRPRIPADSDQRATSRMGATKLSGVAPRTDGYVP